MHRTLLSLLFACSSVLAAPSSGRRHVVHERRSSELSSDWTYHRRLEAERLVPLRIGLNQKNLHELDSLLLSVSDPHSPSYGKHWSAAEVAEHFAPHDDTIAVVMNWLNEAGFTDDRISLSRGKHWININATILEVEELLDTEYHVYQHSSGVQHFGCHSYSLPEDITGHVDFVMPTVQIGHNVPSKSSRVKSSGVISSLLKRDDGDDSFDPTDLSTCDQYITPACLQALYSIDYQPTDAGLASNTFGVVELAPNSFLGSDLDLFFANFSPSQVGQRPEIVLIDGGGLTTVNQTFDINGESDLDLEYAFALTAPYNITLLQTGDDVEGGSFNGWLDAVDGSYCTFEGGDNSTVDGEYPDPDPSGFSGNATCGVVSPPNVISISYGGPEADLSPFYMQRQCSEYAKLGMMGVTVVYSSGDNGVAGPGDVCLFPNGTQSTDGTRFSPQFPATCPYILSVGATQIDPGNSITDPESAAATHNVTDGSGINTGGGFSNTFGVPSYQASAVSNYLRNYTPLYSGDVYNNSGTSRGYPDVAANGINYATFVDSEFSPVSGTSASAPVIASIITLINDARIAANKSAVGFINPLLYAANFSNAINDITNGSNPGCGTMGFNATQGWDPATGVGTLNFTALLPLFLSMP